MTSHIQNNIFQENKNGNKLPFFGNQETDLDYDTVNTAKSLYNEGSLWISTIGRFLVSEVMIHFPEFWIDGQRLNPKPAFRRIIKEYWLPFCKNALEWVWTVGIVAFRLKKVGNGDLIPATVEGIPGQHFRITTWYDVKNDSQRFTYYRMFSKKTGFPAMNEIDKKVFFLSNFGFNPSLTGKINSIVSGIIFHETFLNRLTLYILRAEKERSRPMIITESGKDAFGSLDSSAMFGSFADIDPNSATKERLFRKNEVEVFQTVQHQKNLLETYVSTFTPKKMGVIDVESPQIFNNIVPLPSGQKMTHQLMPECRTDWSSINKVHQETVFAAFNLPRQVLMTDSSGKIAGNADLAQKTFDKTVNHYRTLLSDILTQLYCHIYGAEDCVLDLQQLEMYDLESLTREEILSKIRELNVSVSLPTAIGLTTSQLLQQYALGIITWEQFGVYVKRVSGYNMLDVDSGKKTEDPWNMETKISLLKNSEFYNQLSELGFIRDVFINPIHQNNTSSNVIDQSPSKQKKRNVEDTPDEQYKKKKNKKEQKTSKEVNKTDA